MAPKPSTFPPPIDIVIPAGADGATVIAYLLATIGRPPVSASDRGWRETVSAYRRERLEDEARVRLRDTTGTASEFLPITPEELLLSDKLRADRLKAARLGVERALFAGAVASPEIYRDMLLELGEPLEALPRTVRAPPTRQARIERLMLEEHDVIEDREAAAIPAAPRRIPLLDSVREINSGNVQTRILQPAEPILHLAVSLNFEIDQMRDLVTPIFSDRTAWESEGFGTSPSRQPDGTTVMRPRITERQIFELAGLFARAIEFAELLRPLAEAYILAGRRTSLPAMVCLTRG